MKNRQRKLFALLLACTMIGLPAAQAFAETAYDASVGVDAQVLFPGDSLIGITGGVTVDGEAAVPEQDGTWKNSDKNKVYVAESAEDGTLQLETVGYVLEVEGGSSGKSGEDHNHYHFGDWEKPEKPVDRAYYAKDETVTLTADTPAEGMEFKGWKCDTEGVKIADPSSAETTLTMIDKKVVVIAEYQEVPAEPTTEAATEPPVEITTEAPAEPTTETPAEVTTEPPVEIMTEAPAEPMTEAPAEVTAEPPVEITTEAPEEGGEDVTYTVEVVNGTFEGSTLPGSEIIVTANDRAEDGLQFTGWTVNSENAELYDAAAVTTGFLMPEGSVQLTANYVESLQAPTEYMLTVNDGQGSGSYAAGAQVTVTANDRSAEGLEFAGWFVESMNLTLEDFNAVEISFAMPEGDVILNATFAEPETTAPETEPSAPESETTAPETEPAAPESETTAPETEPAAPESETTALETEPSAPAPESETTAPETEPVAPESETTAPETETAPVEIETEPQQTEALQTEAPQSEAVKYEVTVGNHGIGSGEYAAGETVTVEAQPEAEDGKIFESWQTDSAEVALADPTQEVTSFVMPEKSVTVTPLYANPTYTASVENGTFDDGTGAKNAEAGATITITAKDRTAEGLAFANWKDKDNETGGVIFADAAKATTTFTMPNRAVNIEAVYTQIPNTYQVKVSNGLINGTSTEMSFEENTEITVTANPGPEGQAFSHWVINGGAFDIQDAAYSETIKLTVTENLEILAVYEGIPYAITVEDGYADYEECVSGTVVTITADEAPDGYEFDYWTVDTENASLADAYSDVTTFTMPASEVTVSAHYKQVAFRLTVENGSSEDEYYYAGDEVTIRSNYPASGRIFRKWEAVSGNVSFGDAGRWKTTFTMPATDVKIRATYQDGPSTNDNLIGDIIPGGEYLIGSTIKFTASGAGMGNTNPNPGDYRYRPSGYQIGNVTGTLQSPYSISMAINAAGEYTLKVTYNKDIYDGSNWVSDGTADTKTVTFRVVTKAAGVATGDETPLAAVIALAAVSCVIFVIFLVLFLKRRKK